MDPATQMGSKRHRIQCSNFGKCSRVWGQRPRDTVWFRPRFSSWFVISQLKAQLLGDSGPHSLRPIRTLSPLELLLPPRSCRWTSVNRSLSRIWFSRNLEAFLSHMTVMAQCHWIAIFFFALSFLVPVLNSSAGDSDPLYK